jgi:hypothetical protein
MKISVQVHGNLRSTSAAGPALREYHALPGSRIRELLGDLNICESEVRRVMRNGQHARLDSRLQARDLLELFP